MHKEGQHRSGPRPETNPQASTSTGAAPQESASTTQQLLGWEADPFALPRSLGYEVPTLSDLARASENVDLEKLEEKKRAYLQKRSSEVCQQLKDGIAALLDSNRPQRAFGGTATTPNAAQPESDEEFVKRFKDYMAEGTKMKTEKGKGRREAQARVTKPKAKMLAGDRLGLKRALDGMGMEKK
ncbi:hypothetical protein K458DRAFT_466257 [Lentithecium fluviatile CBS 122367]|uniref:Uncharacterized protein n=1 Tax=Lentithecium fluviatile CBS 122367 TaxID=1168545 RepID=A0A6G1IH45_9PLEO|nr:hypothetical protein K458DRAFT_466257 [Lentithecium fluviatile CBS 122367]